MAAKKRVTAFDIFNYGFMTVICFIVLYPIWFCLVSSFNLGLDIAQNGPVFWWPRAVTLDNYKVIFSDSTILKAYGISIARTIIATSIHVFFTAMVGYAFSKRRLIGRGFYNTMGLITLFFGGGLIPNFMLMNWLGLTNNFMVYIYPTMFSYFNCIIFMNFFRGIPDSLEESARIDGAKDIGIFIRIILPLSKPVLATIAVYSGVWNWNDYFYGAIYIIRNVDLLPIQTFLYKMVATTDALAKINEYASVDVMPTITPDSVKIATMVATTIPIICVYPFLQKYFAKGMLLGAVKG